MRIRQKKQFQYGYNSITEMDGKYADTLMDFGILRLDDGQRIIDTICKERAFLLISGEAEFEWEGHKVAAKRSSCFDEGPWCLHVPSNVPVKILGIKSGTEISIQKTTNDQSFEAQLFTPEDCRTERLGAGTMNETATRIVRTIFNKSTREQSNLVLGETISFPGRWSSYPPHCHPQPEIYFYKFNLENGFGYSEVGDKVYKVRNNDTIMITSEVAHPQVAAPGYAMYYAWVIRHLENLPYMGPTFLPEYLWLTNKDVKFWPDR